MRVIGLLFLVFIVFAVANVAHPSRLFDAETKLGLMEERVAGVGDELMRRSKELARTFEQFRECGATCDASRILQERDRVLREEWQRIFPRLTVRKDWGEARVSRWSRDRFFEELERRGADTLRERCVPRVSYRWPVRGGRKVAEYSFEGFDCGNAAGFMPAVRFCCAQY